ncbi:MULTISPECIES: A24 family peptidase [Vibrio]|uniref:A24 family peptidase n=1 Tax=Vibrio TaxID=662 RepID=UPI0004A3D404|nr:MULTISPECIES: A24 family peptidase [Vibrio]
MDIYAPFWVVMIMIAINDIRWHRIHNNLLILLLLFLVVKLLIPPIDYNEILYSMYGAIALFVFGLILFFLRAMSAGDVKLLFVVGAYVGWGNLVESSVYIVVAGGIVGSLYLFYSISQSGEQVSFLAKNYFFNRWILRGIESHKDKGSTNLHTHVRYKNNLTMPFAPSVVIGLAMFSYFH